MGTAVAIGLGMFAYIVIAGFVFTIFVQKYRYDNDDPLAWFGCVFWPAVLPFMVGLMAGEWFTRPDRVKEALKNGH